MVFASLYWISAVNCLMLSVFAGMARVFLQKNNVIEVWQAIDKYQVSVMCLVYGLLAITPKTMRIRL